MKIKIIKSPNFYKTGGEINIKKSHEGLFTLKANRAGMGVLEFANHVLSNKDNYSSETVKQANFARNAAKWHSEGGNLFNNTFAEGGTILGGYHTNGADWLLPGDLHIIGNGGTHEENKNEGVPLGTDLKGVPNLVEENEVVYNDYVFSNRLTVPKRRQGKEKEISDLSWEEKMLKPYEGKTYAEAILKAYKDVQERPSGTIEKRGFETIAGVLANSQEKERAKQEHQEAAAQINEMSGLEFAQAKAMEELLQAMQLAVQLLAMQLEMQLQQMQELQMLLQETLQLSPEEIAMMQQQLAMQQARLALIQALGGNIHAYGGNFYDNGGQLDLQRYQLIFLLIAQYAEENKDDLPELYEAVSLVKTPLDMLLFVSQFLASQEQQMLQFLQALPYNSYQTGGNIDGNIEEDDEYDEEGNGGPPWYRKLFPNARIGDLDFGFKDALETLHRANEAAINAGFFDPINIIRNKAHFISNDILDSLEATNLLNARYDDITPELWLLVYNDYLKKRDAFNKEYPDIPYYNRYLDFYQKRWNKNYEGYIGDLLEDKQSSKNNPSTVNALKLLENNTVTDKDVPISNILEPESIEPLKLSPALAVTINFLHDIFPLYFPQVTENKLLTEQQANNVPQVTENKLLTDTLNESLKLSPELEALNKTIIAEALQQANAISLATESKGLTDDKGKPRQLTAKEMEKAQRQFIRHYRKKYVDPNKLSGIAAKRYQQDLKKVYTGLLTDEKYDFSKDDTLAINDKALNGRTKKANLTTYNNNALYDDYISKGAKAVEVSKDGKSMWDLITGLTKIDNSADNFYSTPTNFTEANGIYEYDDGSKGYKSENFASPEEFQQYYKDAITLRFKTLKGDKYSDAKLPNYYLNASELRSWVNDLQNSDDPKAKELALALKANWGDANTPWGNDATWELKNRFNKNGSVTESQSYLNLDAVKQNSLQTDALPGIAHVPYLEAIKTNPTASRYFYTDTEGLQHFITRPEVGSAFTISTAPRTAKVGDITYNDYEVTGFNKNRKLYQTPDGRVLDVTDIADEKWKPTDIVMPDDKSNIGEGVKAESTWVKSPEDSDIYPKFPLPSNWPFIVGLGLLAGSTLYNALTPIDYSNSDAIINAAKEAGNYNPIGFRPIGDYLAYRPLDRNYEGNKIRSAMAAERSKLANLSGGNRGTAAANILASDANLISKLGEVDRNAALANRKHEAEVAAFNRGTNQFNSEGFLKADMANLDAASKLNSLKLEGLAKGYAMRQAAEDAKSNAINLGISGIAANLFNLYQNNQNNALLRYGIDSNTYGPVTTAYGGKLKIRRKRDLTF